MRVLTIVNSKSGGSDAGLYDFVRALGMQGAEVVIRVAGEAMPLEGLAHDAQQFDRVVAAGGDGTVSTVCYEMRNTGVPVLAYPAGTANLLALNLGLPVDARALAEVTLFGAPVQFDLGELEHTGADGGAIRTGFAVMAGAGFDAAIMDAAQPLKASFGAAAYLLGAVSIVAPTVSQFELVLDGKHVHTDGIAVLLVNFGRIQFDIAVTHGWDPCDGRLDVLVLKTKNVAGLIPVVFAALLDRIGEMPEHTPGVDMFSAASVELSAYPPLRMQSDGDVLPVLTPCAARALPGAATLMVPQGSVYAPS